MFRFQKNSPAKKKTSKQEATPVKEDTPSHALIQRAHDPSSLSYSDIVQLQKNVGNQAVQQLMSGKKNKTGLPDSLKRGLEHLSGIDVSDVRVKYNSPEPSKVNAHAYAQGNNIYLAPKQEKHIAHEAWHTIQQKQGRVKPTKFVGGVAINDSSSLEREADVMGKRASTIGKLISQFKTKNVSSQKVSATQPVQRYIVNDDEKIVKLFPSKEEKAEQKELLDELNTKVRSKIADIDGFVPKYLDTLIWSAMLKVDDSPRPFTVKDIVSYIKHNAPEQGQQEKVESEGDLDVERIVGDDADPNAVQHAKELTMIYAVAVESSNKLRNLTLGLMSAGKVKADMIVRQFPGVKSMERAAFKAVIKKKGNTQQIADILASSLVYDDIDDLSTALPGIRNYLNNPENGAKLRNVKNRIVEPSPQGYRDILMNIELPSGHVAEIQLHMAKMISAKKKGHKLYEDEREISEDFENIDIPYLKKMFESIDTFFDEQTRDKKATIKHINAIRDARKLPKSKKAEELEKEVEAASAAKLKQEIIRDLQLKAKKEFYGPAWEEEQAEFDDIYFTEIINHVGKFKLNKSKDQDIVKTYNQMFGSSNLISLHEVFFGMAYQLVRGYEKELGRDVIENLAKYSKNNT